MLQNLIICVNAVIPQAVFLAIGIIIKKGKMVTAEEVKSLHL